MEESEAQKILTLRKQALNKMMDALGLRPSRSNATLEAHKRSGAIEEDDAMLDHFDGTNPSNGQKNKEEKEEAKRKKNQSKGKGKVIEIPDSSDAEEDDSPSPQPQLPVKNEDGEEAEGEVVDQKEVDLIFRRAAANDMSLPEMDPPKNFKLELRPYQKQALHWMCAMESEQTDARTTLSLHPLYEEYAFPPDPLELDQDEEELPDSSKLSEDERKMRFFYYSPYSGAISLEVPKASKRCKGGILADEMVSLLRACFDLT